MNYYLRKRIFRALKNIAKAAENREMLLCSAVVIAFAVYMTANLLVTYNPLETIFAKTEQTQVDSEPVVDLPRAVNPVNVDDEEEYDEETRRMLTDLPSCVFKTVEVEVTTGNDTPAAEEPSDEPAYSANIDVTEYMAKLVHAESCRSYDGRTAVATVVMNRIGIIGDDIISVIQRPNQFQPYRQGKLDTDYVCPECLQATIDVLNGYRRLPRYVLYFQSVGDGYFSGHVTYDHIDGEWYSYRPIDMERYGE